MKGKLGYSLLAAALAANLAIGARTYLRSAEAEDRAEAYRNLRLFALVLERVRQDYVEGEKLSYKELIYSALRGMLDALDPHSEFMDPEKFQTLKSDTEGEFGGIGIQIGLRNDRLTVIAPIEGTPASRAGVLSGDQIIKIEDRSTMGMGLEDAVKLLRGKPGTKVKVTFFRPSTGEIKETVMTRAVIQVDTVKDIRNGEDFPLGPDKIGYIRLVQFGERTVDELDAALDKLLKQGMKGLILDLRDDPGGLLDAAAGVCSRFLPAGSVVVSTEGRDPSMRREYRVSNLGKHLSLPMVALVNGGSASASEIVAGCLQDHHRAVLIGERTFGKGSVQSVIPLQDGAALRLTTARYYTPNHRMIHEKGITPDIVIPMSPDELEAIALKRVPGALETLPPARRARLEKLRDRQLERARDTLRGVLILSARKALEAKPGASSVRRLAAAREPAATR
ncbi:MAG: S41 family peptidase [Verrucomicrobia bacterium]|nr:S41 family peptidase [Verrucomicrobiota bacterium]